MSARVNDQLPGKPVPGPEPAAGNTRLTPAQVHGYQFPAARLGHRGLDEEAVRVFRDQVARDYDWTVRELAMLTGENTALRNRASLEAGRPHLVPPTADGNPASNGARILRRAQEIAEAAITDAEDRRVEMMTRARAGADAILEDANRDADRVKAATAVAADDLRVFHESQLESLLKWDKGRRPPTGPQPVIPVRESA